MFFSWGRTGHRRSIPKNPKLVLISTFLMFSFQQHAFSHKSSLPLFFSFPVFHKQTNILKQRSRSHPHRRRRTTLSGSSSRFSGLAAGSAPSPSSDGQVRLHPGMQVFLSSANEMAFIRYLGTADFASGLWLGLELRTPKGKNDGSVGGRRYFSCRPGHGVLVRPSRVTYCGINGSRLVNEKSWKLLNFLFLMETQRQNALYKVNFNFWLGRICVCLCLITALFLIWLHWQTSVW